MRALQCLLVRSSHLDCSKKHRIVPKLGNPDPANDRQSRDQTFLETLAALRVSTQSDRLLQSFDAGRKEFAACNLLIIRAVCFGVQCCWCIRLVAEPLWPGGDPAVLVTLNVPVNEYRDEVDSGWHGYFD